ncbi:MAG: leucine-rich repeat protein [Clostridia bacterium]|nr:leucine-rich repeat protein [Clostridia bacterium]
MKKLLSVFLAILVVVPCFGITSFAYGDFVEFEKDGLYYLGYMEDEVYVTGYDESDFEESDRELTIPATVKKGFRKTYTVVGIELAAFAESGFEKITLPETIREIGDEAFYMAENLQEVVIPAECELEYFGMDVFTGTLAEEKLFGGGDTAEIGRNVLYGYIGNEKDYVVGDNIDLIASGCFMFSGIESITFNENITSIPYICFAGCRNLKSVTIPDTIYYVDDGAFKDCTNLKNVTLGENVSYLGIQSFSNTAIESIHLPQNVSEISGAFMACKKLSSVTVDENHENLYTDGNAVYEKWEYSFEGFDGEQIEEKTVSLEYYIPSKVSEIITIDAEVNQIGDYAFYNCDNMKEVHASELESIGTKAFAGTDVELFDFKGECAIYDGAFYNCTSLKEIDLENVSYITTAAFQNCTSLKAVTLSDGLYVLDGNAFANTAIEEITVTGEDIWLGEGVFQGCENLKKVTLGDGVLRVSMNTFLDCPKLESVYLSKTIDVFEENALNGCENVKFEVIKNTDGHREVKKLGYDFEIVGKLTFLEEISNFFDMLFDVLFGWMMR